MNLASLAVERYGVGSVWNTGAVIPFAPRDVPRLRDRLRRMWATDVGYRLAAADISTEAAVDDPRNTQRGQDSILAESELYWVSSEMGVLLRHAADTMPIATLDPAEMLSPCGFVVFEEALRGLDANIPENDGLTMSAMSWGRVIVLGQRAVRMTFYQRTTEMAAQLYPGQERAMLDTLGELHFLGSSSWIVGTAADDWTGYEKATEEARASHLEDRRLLHAFFLLTRQRVSSIAVREPDRAERRRAQRAGHAEPPAVRVVTLRPRYATGDAPAESRVVNWSHRWVVNGFWRQQWHPSEQRHVPTFISPYVKGPPDKPLVAKDTVHAIRR